jgi:hypothetical protein
MPIDYLGSFSHGGHHRSGKSRSTTADPGPENLEAAWHRGCIGSLATEAS